MAERVRVPLPALAKAAVPAGPRVKALPRVTLLVPTSKVAVTPSPIRMPLLSRPEEETSRLLLLPHRRVELP